MVAKQARPYHGARERASFPMPPTSPGAAAEKVSASARRHKSIVGLKPCGIRYVVRAIMAVFFESDMNNT